MAVLCAWGICTDGSRVLLSLTTGNTESYETSIEFLRDMVQRGLRTPLTVTTDGAPGLTKAIDALWPRTWRVRCWFHKMRNLQDKVPPQAWPEFKALVIDVRDAPTFKKGEQRMQALVEAYKDIFPEACRCLQDDMLASLNHLNVPVRHRPLVRTTNLVERTFVEERRRTKTIPHLWDEKSAIKLVFATLIRVSDRWSRRQFSVLEEQHLKQLRQKRNLETAQEQLKQQGKQRRSAGQVAA
jgi:transposase-like protein